MNIGVRVKRGLVVAGLLLGVVLIGGASDAVLAQTAESGAAVTSIVIEGNRRVEADTIRSYFKVAPGEHLDAAKIDSALKALYASGLFQDIRIAQSGGRLTVTVVEAPVIDRLAFEGNNKIKDEQLQEEIQSKARGTLSRATVQADVQRIIEVYHRNGRFDVQVVPKIIERPNNRVDLIFEIKEGEKTGVKAINFVGNQAYSSSRLKDVIKTSTSNFLSFLQTTDVYDPDRIEADRDLIRRFYLSHGYADVQVVSAIGEYDPAQKGFIITFTIEEGPRYHFGTVDIQSNIRAVDPTTLKSILRMRSGETYNGDSIEKTVEDLTVEITKHGYPFATVRPRGDRNPQNRTISVVFVVDEGVRAYIERINIRGNTRTRDYVIRREFDISEGDPYNRALIDRAERRIKNLNFFKNVKITNEPGSAPDRVVINVDVEEQSTGDFSVMGGYSTAEGFMAQVSISERNLLGTGRFARASFTYGQYIRGAELSFVEPYFVDERMSFGIDLFARETIASPYISYGTDNLGTTLKFGIPLREDLSLQLRYSIYWQEITLSGELNDCNNVNPNFSTTFPTVNAINAATAAGAPVLAAAYPGYAGALASGVQSNCLYSTAGEGSPIYEASLPVRYELAQGGYLTSMAGYGLTYNTLDNNKHPTNGLLVNFGQDFAGLGGNAYFIRSAVDVRSYYEIVSDLVSLLHLQGGDILGLTNCDPSICADGNGYVRMLDDFKMGPNLVRGFQPAGIGPRDITSATANDALGGTKYWGASLEFQYPFFFLPKDAGMRGAVFIDSGAEWGYKAETAWPANGEVNGIITTSTKTSFFCSNCAMQYADSAAPRVSVGASLIWDSPFGPLRFDFAYPILKQPYDRTQWFQFGGGARF
ncbi:MAG TPA: outer membrane protein assembly factor BamA [Xanthobacteraceae bacterium]|nr:outer membrane protein assembly factor BamA [Xanthobacteraceae bacterium]